MISEKFGSAETCLRFVSGRHVAPWSAGTCPRFVSGRHVAPMKSEDMSSHSKSPRPLKEIDKKLDAVERRILKLLKEVVE